MLRKRPLAIHYCLEKLTTSLSFVKQLILGYMLHFTHV